MTKLKHLLLCLLPALIAVGCSDGSTSTTTAPDGTPLVFSGTVGFQGDSFHNFLMFDDGLLSITLTELRFLLLDTTQASPTSVALGFGLGRRDDAGECILTTNVLINKNEIKVYRLSKDTYCLSIFDVGTFPEDALIGYELQAMVTT